jgi:hypothetical protein
VIDRHQYRYLQEAQKFQLVDLKASKDDSFMETTEPVSKINECLAHFSGMFTKTNLHSYLHEALVIVEQDFTVLENSKYLFEVINLVIALLKNNMLFNEFKI